MLKKCDDCDREIPVKYPRCIYCKSKCRREGICWWCGKAPVGKGLRAYCDPCKKIAEEVFKSEFTFIPYRAYRPYSSWENTFETKYG